MVELDEFADSVLSMTDYIIDEREAESERSRMRRRLFTTWRGGDRSKAI